MEQQPELHLTPRRRRILELENKLCLARDRDQTVQDFLELLNLKVDLIKDKLAEPAISNPITFPAIQGQAVALNDLIYRLTTPRKPLPME